MHEVCGLILTWTLVHTSMMTLICNAANYCGDLLHGEMARNTLVLFPLHCSNKSSRPFERQVKGSVHH